MITVTPADLGYDQGVLPARIGTELLSTAATLGLDKVKYLGTAVQVFDAASGGVNVTQGVAGVIHDGEVNLEDALKLTGGIGLVGSGSQLAGKHSIEVDHAMLRSMANGSTLNSGVPIPFKVVAREADVPTRAVDPKTVVNALSFFSSDRHHINGVNVLLDKSGLKHILERHHADFWDGTAKASQSLFPRGMTIDEVRDTIREVLIQNSERVAQIGPNGIGQIEATINGVRYVLGLNRGRVGQFYPAGS